MVNVFVHVENTLTVINNVSHVNLTVPPVQDKIIVHYVHQDFMSKMEHVSPDVLLVSMFQLSPVKNAKKDAHIVKE